jgi:hypothetical protein
MSNQFSVRGCSYFEVNRFFQSPGLAEPRRRK